MSSSQISNAKTLLVFVFVFLSVVVIYNATFILGLLNMSYKFSYGKVYVQTTFIHFFLAIFLLRGYPPSLRLFIICIIIPLIIDCLTFFNGQDLVPLRAPLATIFPILGTALAFIYKSCSKVKVALAFFLSIVFLFVINFYVVPLARKSMIAKKTPIVLKTIANSTFKTVDGKWVKFQDTARAPVRLVECYFVGCPPCEDKVHMLKKLRQNTSTISVDIVMICAGKVSKWESFLQHAAKNVTPGIIYLYDVNNALDSITNTPMASFPMEFLFLGKYENSISALGYDAKDSLIIYKKKLGQINNWLGKHYSQKE